MPQLGVLTCCSSVCQVRLYHQRPACGWCLMGVGHNTSSASLGWSLLPSTVIIVLALINSAGSPVGTSSISTRPRSSALLPGSTASTGLLCLSVGARVHRVRSDTELSMWPLLCAHHIQCMTYIYIYIYIYIYKPNVTLVIWLIHQVAVNIMSCLFNYIIDLHDKQV